MTDGELAGVVPVFRAVVETAVPEATELDAGEWTRLRGIVEEALSARPPAIRRQLRLFLRVLDWLPLLRYGRRFPGLGPRRRRAVLERLQDAPLLPVRRGVWGVRTLAFMGYYGRPEVYPEIGYRAHPRGWEAPEDVGPEPEGRGPEPGGRG